MRKIVLLVALLAGVVSAQAQNALLSPTAAMKALEIRQGKCQAEYVHAFAVLAEGVDRKALDAYGVKINSVVGDMATAQIPVKRFADVVASGLCSYIDLGYEPRLHNDLIRDELGINFIHQGLNLPHGYDGTGVVVGIIDIGLHYGHPSFYDSTGTTLRIKRVWQQLDTTGTPPAGFTYGRELTTPEEMLAAVTDRVNQGHGSHVAGMAAGCGAPDGNGRRYRGIAPAADIVMVGTTLRFPDIFDGIRYIHEYAQSVGKPCVINISIGSILGPHDGTESFDMMANAYLNGGNRDSVVVMVSAGNDGSFNRHLHHQFSPTDTVVRTCFQNTQQENFQITADCWGDVGDRFSLQIVLNDRDGATNQLNYVASTPVISTEVDSAYVFEFRTLRDSIYQCDIVVSHANQNNNRPDVLFAVYKQKSGNMADVFSLVIKSDSADVHCWSSTHSFSNYNDPQYAVGDDEYTVSGMGTNSDAVIAVGSYTTRNKRVSGDGNVSSLTSSEECGLSFFTSRGPTWDGRVKPDICSPGEYIVSVFSTPYIPYYPGNLMYDSTVFNGETYYYCLMRGTSMAAPSATGVVALWMQQNPSLSVDSVRAILHATGRRDSHTGAIPATGDNNWGWGKIDAYGGLPATSVPMHYLDVSVDNLYHGVVTGRGRHPEGLVTIQVTSFNGFAFRSWNDGNTDNPRLLNLTSDISLVAFFDTVPCDTVTHFPWNIEFQENNLFCWDNFTTVEGGQPWVPFLTTMTSAKALTADEVDSWLVSPYVIPEANTSLFYKTRSQVSDSLAIVVITDEGDSVVIADDLVTVTTDELHVDLTPYAGQLVRFAFNHHATTEGSAIVLASGRIDYLQGIENVDSQGYSVATSGLRVTIDGAPTAPLSVFDALGRCVHTASVANGTFSLPSPGVYVVKVGNLPASKVVVVR